MFSLWFSFQCFWLIYRSAQPSLHLTKKVWTVITHRHAVIGLTTAWFTNTSSSNRNKNANNHCKNHVDLHLAIFSNVINFNETTETIDIRLWKEILLYALPYRNFINNDSKFIDSWHEDENYRFLNLIISRYL